MGTYRYVAKRSNPITASLEGKKVKVYRMSFFCLERDTDKPFFDFDGFRTKAWNKLMLRLSRIENAWNASPDLRNERFVVIHHDDVGEGDEVFRIDPNRFDWADCSPFPGEYIGGLKKVGKSWEIDRQLIGLSIAEKEIF